MTDLPENMTALQVVLAVDEIPRITECPLGISNHQKLCPLHRLLDDTSRLVEEAFAGVTIEELVPGRKQSQSCRFPKKQSS